MRVGIIAVGGDEVVGETGRGRHDSCAGLCWRDKRRLRRRRHGRDSARVPQLEIAEEAAEADDASLAQQDDPDEHNVKVHGRLGHEREVAAHEADGVRGLQMEVGLLERHRRQYVEELGEAEHELEYHVVGEYVIGGALAVLLEQKYVDYVDEQEAFAEYDEQHDEHGRQVVAGRRRARLVHDYVAGAAGYLVRADEHRVVDELYVVPRRHRLVHV